MIAWAFRSRESICSLPAADFSSWAAAAIRSTARALSAQDYPARAVGILVGYGLGAPRNCPAESIVTLNRAINAVLADPQTKAQLAALGSSPAPGLPAEFGRLIAEDSENWAKVVTASGARPE